MSRLSEVPGRLYRGEVSVDFVGKRRMWYSISGLIILISLILLLVRGLAFSVDFKGGAIFEISKAPASVSVTQVQKAVTDAGVSDAIVQHVGSGGKSTWQVQTKALTQDQANKVTSTLATELGVPTSEISPSTVSASWGSQITHKALQALIAFLVVIVIYLSIAFNWKMAVASFVALLHTLVITIGVYALTGFDVSPATVIGFLTILGYALYDTVVVFDKVRENTAGLLGGARLTYSGAANLALNQTLVRSINTSLIALLPVSAILVVSSLVLAPGNELQDLSLVLLVGILAGAYASICIATPVLAQLKEREPQYRALAKRVTVRASGGRAAKKESAKAGGGRATGSRPGGRATANGTLVRDDVADDLSDGLVDDGDYAVQDDGVADVDDGVIRDDQAPDQASRPGQVSRPAPATGRSVGPRQQPRRDGRGGSSARRPTGKKKRR